MASDQEQKPSRVIPVLLAALLCDAATTDFTGKKTLIGIFDRLWAERFPTSRPMWLYLKITDAEGHYRLTARIVHAGKDRAVGEARGEIDLPNRLLAWDFLLPFPPVPFQDAGRYEFQIFMNDTYLGRAVLDAQPKPQPGA